jgi:ribosome-associated translation inhibitor RaiA
MNATLTVTFRHLPRTGALESAAREVGQRLQFLNDRMTGCHIVLEDEGRSDKQASTYVVKIHVSVPGAQIHAEGGSRSDEGAHDARRALRVAYESAKRQLEKLNQVRTKMRVPAL